MKKNKIVLYEQNEATFTHNGIKVLHPISCYINRDLFEYTYDLDMEYPIDDTDTWKEITEGRIIKANGQLFRIVYTDKSVLNNTLTVYAKHIFFDLQNNFIEDTNIISKNGNMALGQLLGATSYDHNFSSTSDISILNNMRCVRKNVLEAILGDDDNTFINRWGGEFDVDNFNIKMLSQVGSDNGYKISYGKNLTGLTFKTDYTNIVTRIRPIGFDGIELPDDNKYVDSAYIDNYAMPIIKEYKYENVKWSGSPNYDESNNDEEDIVYDKLEDAQAELINLASLEFAENEVDLPQITCNVNFIELFNTEEYSQFQNLETVSLGDIVKIYHKPFDINMKARCISYKYDCILNQYDEITIGTYQKNFFSQTAKNNEKLDDVTSDISEQIQSVYSQAITKMSDMMNASMNGYVVLSNSEILIMNTPDKTTATNVWKFSSAGIAHSSTGYNGEYTVGMTMDGHINGQLITAGTIKGDMLEAGTITTRELAVEIQNTINTAMTQETTQALITANLNTFESSLSQTFVTQENITEQIQNATEVAVEQATQEIIDNAVSQSMASVESQLDDKFSVYTDSTLTPAITQAMNDAIDDSKDYVITTLNDYATKSYVGSSIQQTREEIELGVSSTYETIANTTTKIEEAIDGVNIGAVNRVFGTAEEKSYIFNGSSNDVWIAYDISSDIADKDVLVSFEYDLDATVENGSVLKFQSQYVKTSNSIVYIPSYTLLSWTSTQTVSLKNQFVSFSANWSALKQDARFRFRADGVTGTFTIRKAQIKVGNKVTEWSIAPEDIETNANNYTVQQLTNYYTMEQTDSRINIAKEEINLGVSSIYETKTNVETYIQNINDTIDNIDVGGRNFLLDSRNLSNGWKNSGSFTKSIDDDGFTIINRKAITQTSNMWYGYYTPKIPITKIGTLDTEIVFSVDMKVTSLSSWDVQAPFIFELYNSSNTRVAWADVYLTSNLIEVKPSIEDNTWVRLIYKRKIIHSGNTVWSGGYTSDDVYSLGIRLTLAKNGNIYFRKPKLEIGNIATDWSPAPEDADNDIANAKNEAINSANNTLTTTIANYYTKNETDSAITIAKEEINLGVSSTYETKTNVESYVETINNTIDNIEIGGTNLLPNSNFEKDLTYWSVHDLSNSTGTNKSVSVITGGSWADPNVKTLQIKGTSVTDRYGVMSNNITLTANTTYTISGYYAGHRVGNIQINIRDIDASSANIKTVNYTPVTGGNSLSKYGKFEVTFTTTSNTHFAVNLYSVNLADDGYVWFANIKLEKGNKATDWSPCPQDTDDDISTAKDEAIDSANNTLTSTIANYYTKSQTDSQINIAKEEINLGVSSTYETKSNVESYINNINTSINSIEVGGRNLVSNGAPYNTDGWYALTGWNKSLVDCTSSSSGKAMRATYTGTNTGYRGIYKPSVNGRSLFVNGEYYTISAWIRSSKDCKMSFRNEMMSDTTINVTTSWQKFVVTKTVNTSATNSANIFYVNSDYIESNMWFEFHSLKIEHGTKATEWSPSPEEVDNNILTAKTEAISTASADATTKANNAKNDAITSANNTLTTTIANYYTKAQTDSQINIAKEEINLGVSSTYETIANVTTKIDNITVGGKNLIKQSKSLSDTTGTSSGHWEVNSTGNLDEYKQGVRRLYIDTTSTSWCECQIPLYSVINTIISPITVSFYYYESVEGMLRCAIGSYNGTTRLAEISSPANNCKIISDDGIWKRVSFTINDPSSLNSQSGATVYKIQFKKAYGYSGLCQVKYPKVEIGNKATDWSPAPEDTEIYIEENYYTKEETDSQINIAKDAINLGVSSTYETIVNVTNKINGIEIGGTNLLLNSAFIDGTTNWDLSTGVTLDSTKTFNGYKSLKMNQSGNTGNVWRGATQHLSSSKLPLLSGDTYTYSCWYYCEDASTLDSSFALELKGIKEGSTSSSTINSVTRNSSSIVVGKWTRIYGTITLTSNWTDAMIYPWIQKNGTVWVTAFKVEKGNKPTSWNLAPDDTYTKSQTDSQINIAKDAINLSVSSTYATKDSLTTNYYTKSETLSQINIAKDAINLEVAKKANSDSIISSINLSPETIKISSNKVSIDGAVVINSINDCTSTSIVGDRIKTGVISSNNNRIKFDLNEGYILAYDESGDLVGRTISNKLKDTDVYGMSSAAEPGHYVSMSYRINDDDETYTFGVVCTGTDGVGGTNLKTGVNIQAPMYINNDTTVNGYLSWKSFIRSAEDRIDLYKSSTSSASNLILRLADDTVTNFMISCNHYSAGHKSIATFHYTNDSSATTAGIDFYQTLNMHSWRILNCGNISSTSVSTASLSLSSDTATVQSSSPIALMALDNDFNDIQQATKTQYIATSTQKQITHTGTIDIGSDKIEYIELPEDFMMCIDIQIVATPNKLCQFAITDKDEFGFIIETDTEDVTFDYIVTGTKFDMNEMISEEIETEEEILD